MSDVDAIARAICAEQCAVYGEPPCHQIGPWPNQNCDEPGCMALAKAAIAALPAAAISDTARRYLADPQDETGNIMAGDMRAAPVTLAQALPPHIAVRMGSQPEFYGKVVIRNLNMDSESDMVVIEPEHVDAFIAALAALEQEGGA